LVLKVQSEKEILTKPQIEMSFMKIHRRWKQCKKNFF